MLPEVSFVGTLFRRCLTMATSLFSGFGPSGILRGCDAAETQGHDASRLEATEAAYKPPAHATPQAVCLNSAKQETTFRRLFRISRHRELLTPPGATMTSHLTDERAEIFLDTVKYLCSRYGNVGLSAGILEDGQTMGINVGTPGGSKEITTSQDTIFLISSMTKPIIALAVANIMGTS